MNFLKGVNATRRSVVRWIVKDLAHARVDETAHIRQAGIKRVLICRPNHRLGNLLLVTPLLLEVTRIFPYAKIDLFVKGHIPPVIFRNFDNVDRIIALPRRPLKSLFQYLRGWMKVVSRRYDIVINVVWNSGSGTIATRLVNSKYVFHGDLPPEVKETHSDHRHMAKFPVYGFRYHIAKMRIKPSQEAIPALDLRLSPEELSEGGRTLLGLVKNNKRTIALYTYATGAKCYDKTWWQELYDRLCERYRDFNIIEILPVENVSQISFSAPSFYSRDLRLIGAVIANVDVFIGADSGMMHLASAVNTPVAGLFKADNIDTYRPYNNGSVGINTRETDIGGFLNIIDRILLD